MVSCILELESGTAEVGGMLELAEAYGPCSEDLPPLRVSELIAQLQYKNKATLLKNITGNKTVEAKG